MEIYTAIFFLALLAEIVIRAPINRKRKLEKIHERHITGLEITVLFLLWGGMFILPVMYAATTWLNFANYQLPTWAGWLGVLIIAGAVFVFWRAHADLGLNWSPTLEIREKHELITHGIYGFIRHPMYASQFLWSIAQALLLHNWIAAFASLVVFIPFYVLRVRAEEQLMLEQFGDGYRSYMENVGGLFPKF